MTVLENVVAPLREFRFGQLNAGAVSGPEAARAEELLDFVGMRAFRDQRAAALSYGQQKLVELAQILMLDPKLIMLDEPAGGINPTLIERMGDMIRELNAQGKTFLIVEHNMPFVLGLCDPVLVLASGQLHLPGHAGAHPEGPAGARRLPGRGLRARGGRRLMLRLSGVIAGYGGGDVLQGVDLEVARGTIACIVGPNGAGKSTVLRAVSGLLRPREGEIRLDGARLDGLSTAEILRQGVAQVPQSNALFPNITVRENVLMGAYIERRDKALVRRRYAAVEELFPVVAERGGEKAGNLSGGQRRMVEFARSLMLEPSAGDARRAVARARPEGAQARARSVLRMRDAGCTILLVEQNVRFGLRLANQGIVMESGRVLLDGPADQVLANPEMADLYFGGSVRQAKPPAAPGVTGALWAAASGIGFGLFQSINRRALRDIEDAFVSTFLQLAVAAAVLSAACAGDRRREWAGDAPAVRDRGLRGRGHRPLPARLDVPQPQPEADRRRPHGPAADLAPLFGLPVARWSVGTAAGGGRAGGDRADGGRRLGGHRWRRASTSRTPCSGWAAR